MFQIPVFISHSWAYSGHYDTLADWIFGQSWTSNGVPILFQNVSVPRDNPIHYAPNEPALKAAIYHRINMAAVVVIPTGMYANHSKWIQKEIDGAKAYCKPILAVNPWAQEKKSSVVIAAANDHVGWNKSSVVEGVWRLGPYG